MTIRIGRTLPPAASPIPFTEVFRALSSSFLPDIGESSFKKEIKQVFGQRYCFFASSGKAALVLILQALLKMHPGRDEVLIPAFTCYSVPAAIKRAGLKIKLCDTGLCSLDFDKEQLRKIIKRDSADKRILCILVTHLFGCSADFETIKEIVGDQIPLVEDAAQAMGEKNGEKKLGTLADIGFFSLGRGKPLSTMGGGIIITNRKELGDELARLSKKLEKTPVSDSVQIVVQTILTTLLQRPGIFWIPKLMPFLRLGETLYEEDFPLYWMSPVQIGLARNWRNRLKLHKRVRTENCAFWVKNLPKKFATVGAGQKQPGLIRFPVLALTERERDLICLRGERYGAGIMPTYPTPINEITQIADEFTGQHYPNAKRLSGCLLTLPVHEYVRDSDRADILKLLKKRLGNQ